MAVISDNLLEQLLQTANPETKNEVEAERGSAIPVRCHSSTCKGRIIAMIVGSGTDREHVESVNTGETSSGLLSWRRRLDGHYGFACACGNDSRIAKCERGIIGAEQPSSNDIQTIFSRLKATPAKRYIRSGLSYLDKFSYEVAA